MCVCVLSVVPQTAQVYFFVGCKVNQPVGVFIGNQGHKTQILTGQ